MSHKIVVSIINYRTGALTLQCALSVLAAIKNHDVHIVIVDNFSGDGSAEEIQDWIAAQPTPLPVTLLNSPTNSGFSGGHNYVMSRVPGEAYLLLNSDAILRETFFCELLKALKAYPNAGIIAPRIETDDGVVQNSCFRFPSPLSELIRAAQKNLVTNLFKRHEVALGPNPDPTQIEWASFACILLRGEMVRQIDLMDEGYFLYFEDAEYCLRARRANWPIAYARQAVAVHFRGGSGPVKSLFQERRRLPKYYYASRTRFLYQAYGWHGVVAANLLWYIGRCVAHSSRLLGKRIKPAVKAEGVDIWINVTRPLGPRLPSGDS